MARYPKGTMLHQVSSYTIEGGQVCIHCSMGILSSYVADPSKIHITANGVSVISYAPMSWLAISPTGDIWGERNVDTAQRYGAKLCTGVK